MPPPKARALASSVGTPISAPSFPGSGHAFDWGNQPSTTSEYQVPSGLGALMPRHNFSGPSDTPDLPSTADDSILEQPLPSPEAPAPWPTAQWGALARHKNAAILDWSKSNIWGVNCLPKGCTMLLGKTYGLLCTDVKACDPCEAAKGMDARVLIPDTDATCAVLVETLFAETSGTLFLSLRSSSSSY